MNKNFSLLENEIIDFEIKKKRIFPFLVSDLLYLGMILIFCVVFQTIDFQTIDEISTESILKLLPVLFFLSLLMICLNDFYNRYVNVFELKIILTNFRLIVIDKKELLVNEFYFHDFPKISFDENAYNNGTLIIGETVKTKSYPYRDYESYSFKLYNVLEIRRVVSLIEHKIFIDDV